MVERWPHIYLTGDTYKVVVRKVSCSFTKLSEAVRWRDEQLKRHRADRPAKTCPICGEQFQAAHPRQVYDKKECRNKADKQTRERNREPIYPTAVKGVRARGGRFVVSRGDRTFVFAAMEDAVAFKEGRGKRRD